MVDSHQGVGGGTGHEFYLIVSCWKLNLISGFFIFSGYLIGRMESINVAGVLQEAGDADSRAGTRSQV